MHSFPKITVVTPNYNQGDFLERTINSVLNQNYPNLEYIIIDGGSNDNSIEIIKKYESRLSYWESASDKGMYHALNKGFSLSTGDIMCWINSDDMLHENSLNYVALVFMKYPFIKWIQGYPSVIDEFDQIILEREPVFSKYFFYLEKFKTSYSFIQQESTFWSKDLWIKSGGSFELNYSLAADFDLWLRFFKHEKLYCTKQKLGSFRKRANQKSSNMKLYIEEACNSVSSNGSLLSNKDKFILILYRFLVKNKFINSILEGWLLKPNYI